MKVAIIGTVGLPARYGGFETLAANLVHYGREAKPHVELTVWCSSRGLADRPIHYEHALLRYVPLKANGFQSVPYDVISLVQAAFVHRHDRILVLGVSGALALPLIRALSDAKLFTNIDGIEWRRNKWNCFARWVLRVCEWIAVNSSHAIIADNDAIADYVRNSYGRKCNIIAYGGDHAQSRGPGSGADALDLSGLPPTFALALCRIEPENNAHVILSAWSQLDLPLVFVGNWSSSSYGRALRTRYSSMSNIYLLDPVYDDASLYAIRSRAMLYVHGHSAGGTNPSLVEIMHFAMPVIAYDCCYNVVTTEGRALYFATDKDLVGAVRGLCAVVAARVGADMQAIARRRYTWAAVGKAYYALFEMTDTS